MAGAKPMASNMAGLILVQTISERKLQ